MKRNTLTAKRGVIALAAIVSIFAVLSLRVGYLTLIKGDEYRKKAETQQLSVSPIHAARGTIYDSNMNVLAQSASVWLVYINPSKVTDKNRETVVKGLVELLGADETKLRADIEKNSDKNYLRIKKEVEYAEKKALMNYVYDNGITDVVFVDPDTKRYYPDGTLVSTVIGFTGDDGNGLSGLEYYYDERLTGSDGRTVTAKDGVQNEINNAYEYTYEPKNGENLVLTIDNEIQTILVNACRTAYEENKAANVYGMVMDTKTGAVLAQCNVPSYDSNSPFTIADKRVQEEIDKLTDEEEKKKAVANARFSQWKNKAIADFYEPGSVFKVFLVSAALEEGVINDGTQYTCSGRITIGDRSVKDYNPIGHGVETPRSLLVNSCNTFSVYVGQLLGIERFYKYFEAFGFTEKTGIDLPDEGKPAANITYHSPEISFTNSDLISSSFGQSISVTPIQIITAVSALGNGGKLMQPHIIKKTVDSSGNTLKETKPVMKRQVISEATSSLMASYMEDVVKRGTGKNAYVPGYHVAGKTGTSEKLNSDKDVYLASFAGFAPCDNPAVSVVIIIDEPSAGAYTGGSVAAPVAGEVIEKTLHYLGIEPEYSAAELEQLSESAPELSGRSLEDAIEVLNKSPHEKKIVGSGDTVLRQFPEAGRTMPKNGLIVLYTEENAEPEVAVVPDFSGLTPAQANRFAVNSGFNIRMSGSSFTNSDVIAYRQEYPEGSELEAGSIITVYFRSISGTED